MQTRIVTGVSFFLLSTNVSAQAHSANDAVSALNDWRARFGSRWTAHVDPASGHAEMIYGGRTEWPGVPVTDAEWIVRAQVAIAAARDLHGVDVATLKPDRVTFLPLGMIGSGDKWSVDLHQELGGIRVRGGEIVALFDARGGLLSIQNHALAEVGQIELEPVYSSADARAQAVQSFEKEFAVKAASISQPILVVLPMDESNGRVGHLAWEVDVQSAPDGADPIGRRSWIDARFGYPLRDEASIHFDISGTISTMATPGTAADTAANPEAVLPAKYLRIQHSAGVAFTDASGNFTIPGASAPENVTLSYVGIFGDADDAPTGVHASESVVLNPGPGNNVLLNALAVDTVTAQANVFNQVSTVRDWVRRINLFDATADRVFTGHANIASTCNGFYNGSSINFYAAGGSCNNTGFSTVIGHETGHWLNDLYGTNNGSDGMGEGNADVFALYVYDTPLNGEGFFTNGGAVRTGNNTRQFCGDCNPGCYGEVHRDGEPWMGAAWKVRTNLDNSLGNALGDFAAGQIFMGWMNGFNQRQVRSVIELQWLILDDDDANLANGTPHATEIKSGFRVQGFPGYEIEFANVTSIAGQSCEASSYPVTANVRTLQQTSIASVTLRYRVSGGAWIDTAMSPIGGDDWRGAVPFVLSPATVEYTVEARDTLGNVKAGFCGTRSFFIGQVASFAGDDFESSSGWTHGSVGDTSNSNDDWQRAAPLGKSGTSQSVPWTDPAAAALGSNCFGNDLGVSTSAAGNGAYQSNVHNFLRSPVFDCTGQTGVNLVYKRWLTVEKSQFDIARVLVNDVEVWRNPVATHVIDTGWTTQSIDISALADGNPSVTIQFELQTDAGLELGGWQIDDLRLGHVERAPQCSPIQDYCAGDGSLATACPCNNFGALGHGCGDAFNPQGGLLTALGTTNPDTVVLTSSGLPNGAPGVYFQQDGFGEQAFQNGVLCGGGNAIRLRVKFAFGGGSTFPDATDPFGLAASGLVVPGSGARRQYALWYRSGSSTFCTPTAANLTNGVMITW